MFILACLHSYVTRHLKQHCITVGFSLRGAAFIPCLKYGIRNYVAVPQGFSASLPYKLLRVLSTTHNNMAKSDRLQGYRSDHTWRSFARGDRPENLVFSVVISILLHSILFLGSDYWLRAFAPKEELSEPIPIEYVEVPPNTTKTPPQTSRRAAKDSIAGGKAKPQTPISTAKSASSTAPTSAASKPSEILLPEQTQQKAGSPNRSPQKLQPEPQKSAVAPTTKQPEPLQSAVAPTRKPPEPQPLPTAVAPTTKPLALKRGQTTLPPTTKPLALKPRQTTVAPTTKPSAALTRQGNRDRLAAKSSPQQLENRRTSQSSQGARGLSPRKVSRVQPSSKSGGASRLGGPISLSSRDFASSNQAALPNSNRLNQSVDGIDARQDADMSAYLQQLQEQVRQQWIPGLTQSSRRTVLQFTVSRAGLVSNLRVAQTSGLSMTDEAAVNAVKQAVPFAPLPTAYTQNYINIQFTFNINIYGELELGRDGQ